MNDTTRITEYHDKQKQFRFLLLTLLLAAFCVLKVLRGNDTDSTAEGGIWNIISLLYYPIFIFAFLENTRYRLRTPFVSTFIYVVLVFLLALIHTTTALSISLIYRLLMLPYAALVFWTFYLCSEHSAKGEKIILLGYLVCLVLNVYAGATMQFDDLNSMTRSDIYFSLGLFPFALQFLTNKRWRVAVIVLQFAAVFLSAKRTALLAFVVALVVYYLVDAQIKAREKFLQAFKTVLLLAVALFVFYIVSRYIDARFDLRIYDRLLRLTEDGGSGRDLLYARIWNAFRSSSFMEQLFGHGMNTAGRVGGFGQAHNDLLEVLYDYGVFAVLALIAFYISLIAESVRLAKRRSPYAAAFAFSLIVGLFLAMFSYFFTYFTYVTAYLAFWGYVLCMENKRLKANGGELNERS